MCDGGLKGRNSKIRAIFQTTPCGNNWTSAGTIPYFCKDTKRSHFQPREADDEMGLQDTGSNGFLGQDWPTNTNRISNIALFSKNSLALQKGAAQPSHGKKSMFLKKMGRPLLKNMLCIPTNERIGSNPHFLHGWPLLMLLWWKLWRHTEARDMTTPGISLDCEGQTRALQKQIYCHCPILVNLFWPYHENSPLFGARLRAI